MKFKIIKSLIVVIFLSMILCHNLMAGISAEFLFSIKTGLNQPTDTAVSHNGDIYSLNGVLGKVLVFSSAGEYKFKFGNTGSGDAELYMPMAISVSNKKVYIADTGNSRISVFNLQGQFIRHILLISNKSEIKEVSPVFILVMDKKIIWSDRQNHQICISQINNGKALNCWGGKGDADGQFNYPYQLVTDTQDYVFVVDVLNARIQSFNQKGKHFMNIGYFGVNAPGSLFRPNGLALTKDSYLLVSDAYLGTVSLFKNGRALGLLGNSEGKELAFKSPTSLTLNKARLYVTDTLDNSINVFNVVTGDNNNTRPFNKSKSDRSQKNCISCHISWAENYSIKHRDDLPVTPVAHRDMCYSCHHGVVIDSRNDIGHKQQHPDIHHKRDNVDEKSENKDEAAKKFPVIKHDSLKSDELYCGSCHTPHKFNSVKTTGLNSEHNNSWMRESNASGEVCISCHKSKLDHIQYKKRPAKGVNHPIGIYLKQTKSSNNNQHYFARDNNLHKGLPKDLLNVGASLNTKQQLVCQSCHKVHGSEEESLTAIESENAELCQQCHQRHAADNSKLARKKGVHPVNIKLEKPVKINGKQVEVVTCLSCHDPHNGKKDTALLVVDNKDGDLCNACHKDYNKLVNTDHDLRLSAEKSKNRYHKTPEQAGACGSCHSMHEAADNVFSLDATSFELYKGNEKPLQRDQACLNCHRKEGIADKTNVKFFSHPVKNLILRSAKNKMPLVDNNEISEFGEIACITCHNPHRWSAHKSIENNEINKKNREININGNGNVLSSFLRNKSIEDSFCKDCHGIETALKYKYYHLELSR